mgnify:CR=1 FL=1
MTAEGPCSLKVQFFDALEFAMGPTSAVPKEPAGGLVVDTCGRFRGADLPEASFGFMGVAVDDPVLAAGVVQQFEALVSLGELPPGEDTLMLRLLAAEPLPGPAVLYGDAGVLARTAAALRLPWPPPAADLELRAVSALSPDESQPGRPSAADLVPPLPLTYLPLALALAGVTTDFAALKEADELLTRLLWQEPAVPLVLPTAGYSLLRHLENFHSLSNREELHGLLTDPDWDARGIFILSLLNRVNWPDLLPSAHLWNGKAPHPPKLARIIAEMARREEQYFQDQAPVREAARQAERERRRKAEEDIIRPFLEAERSVIHR